MNGYLHRVRLRPGLDLDQQARALPPHAYAEHKLVWRWFADGAQRRDFLFRREHQAERPTFYVLSQREAVDRSGCWDIDTKPFNPRLAAGERLAFVLRANPVTIQKVERTDAAKTAWQERRQTQGLQWKEQATKRRVRHDVVADLKHRRYAGEPQRPPLAEIVREAGMGWLETQARSAGFTLEVVGVDGYRQQRWYKPGADRPITLSTVDFEGILTVREPETFLERLLNGIGPAKSFGCGLLLVRRA